MAAYPIATGLVELSAVGAAVGRPFSALAGAVIAQALGDLRSDWIERAEDARGWLEEGAGADWAQMLGADAVVADELDE